MRYFLIVLLALVAVASAGRQLRGKNRNLNTFPFNANQPSRRKLEAEASAGYGGHQRSYGYGLGGYVGYGHPPYGKRSADPEPVALADPIAAAKPVKFPFKTISSNQQQQGHGGYGYGFGGNRGGHNGGQIGGQGYGKKTTNIFKRFFGGNNARNLLGRKKREADSEAAADYQDNTNQEDGFQENRDGRSLLNTFPFNTDQQRRTLNTFNSDRRSLVGTFPFNQRNQPAAGTRWANGVFGGHYGGHHGGYHGGYGHHGKRSADPEPVAVADPVAAAGTFPFNTRTISSSSTNQQQGRHGGYGYTGYGHRYGYGLRGNQGGYNAGQNGGYGYGKKPTKRYSSRF